MSLCRARDVDESNDRDNRVELTSLELVWTFASIDMKLGRYPATQRNDAMSEDANASMHTE